MNQVKVKEEVISTIWKKQYFTKNLRTVDGESVEVSNLGVENVENGGPDFSNAKIRIGNLIYVGDVELDKTVGDWKAHGHNLDKKYNRVILQVSLFNKDHQQNVFCKDGRKIPTICLSDFIDKTQLEVLQMELDVDSQQNSKAIKCSNCLQGEDTNLQEEFVKKLGIERLKRKCDRIFFRLKELSFVRELNLKEPVIRYDLNQRFISKEFTYEDFQSIDIWYQLFYECLFEALGYSKNKKSMIRLTQAVNVDVVKKYAVRQDFQLIINTLLFKVAGFLEDELENIKSTNPEYFNTTEKIWGEIRNEYDGRFFNLAQWSFAKLRPQNFPTIRVAGGAILLNKIINNNLIESLIKKITGINKPEILIRILRSMFIVKAEGFWKSHYTAKETASADLKYFIGGTRADEITVNVVIPFFSVYFEVFGKQELAKKLLLVYSAFVQNEDNSIVKNLSESLKIQDTWRKSLYSQGLLELYRSYCSRNRCLECEIGKTVFN